MRASDDALEDLSDERRCCYVCFEPCADVSRCACVHMGLHQRCLVQMLEHGHDTRCRVCGTAFRGVRVEKHAHLDCRKSMNRIAVYAAFCSVTASLMGASAIVAMQGVGAPLSVFMSAVLSMVALSMGASLVVLMSIYRPCASRVETRLTVGPASSSATSAP